MNNNRYKGAYKDSYETKRRMKMFDKRDDIMGELEELARDTKDCNKAISESAWRAYEVLNKTRDDEESG